MFKKIFSPKNKAKEVTRELGTLKKKSQGVSPTAIILYCILTLSQRKVSLNW